MRPKQRWVAPGSESALVSSEANRLFRLHPTRPLRRGPASAHSTAPRAHPPVHRASTHRRSAIFVNRRVRGWPLHGGKVTQPTDTPQGARQPLSAVPDPYQALGSYPERRTKAIPTRPGSPGTYKPPPGTGAADPGGGERLTERITAIGGEAGLRCVISYAAIARLGLSALR